MKKLKAAALLALAASVLAGCALVEKTAEEDVVVAVVNGTQIFRSDAKEMADIYAGYYGIEVDSQDTMMQQQYQQLINSALDSLVTNELLLQKAPDLGISLTDDEKAVYRQKADNDFASVKAGLRANVEEEAKIDASIDVEKETERRYKAYIDSRGSTPDSYYEYLCEQGIVTKVTNHIYGLTQLTDADIKAWYDDTLAIQIDEMENAPEAFEAYVHQRNIYAYVPEDTVAVKQVLLTFDDEGLVAKATALYTQGKRDEAYALLQPEIDRLMPTARTVMQRIRDGEPIEDLIAEFGEDPNIITDPYNVYGYLVDTRTTRYGDEFKDAALGLFNVGDVSEPFASLYGLHVLQSIKVYHEGEIPFEDVKEQIREALLPAKETEMFTQMTQEWLNEAEVIYYRERLL